MNLYIQQIHYRDNIHNREYDYFYYRDNKFSLSVNCNMHAL